MSSVTALMGTGMAAEQARVLGYNITSKTAATTAQATATPITSNFTVATTAVGQTALRLSVLMAGAGPFIVYNSTATAALVFPPVGGNMNGTLNASVSAPANRATLFYSLGSGNWVSNISA